MITSIDSIGCKVDGVRSSELIYFTGLVWQPKQKIYPTIKSGIESRLGSGRGGQSLLTSRVSIKNKGPANGLEGSALRLKMIDPLLQIIQAKSHTMRTLCPGKIYSLSKLLVVEIKWISGIRISHVRPACDLECTLTSLKTVRPVRSRNVHSVGTKLIVKIKLCTEILKCLTINPVDQKVRVKCIVAAGCKHIHLSGGSSQLATIESISAGITQNRWLCNVSRGETEASPYL